jgi:hypothetical protein
MTSENREKHSKSPLHCTVVARGLHREGAPQAREPDLAVAYKVGEFSTIGEAELVAEEYYGDMHVELEQRPGGLIVLWVWE